MEMTECQISGCRNLKTTCVNCGMIVCSKTLPKVNEWINVKDKYPDHNQKVIFFVKDRQQCFCGIFEKFPEHRIISSTITNIFFENLDDWWFEDETITHWMPLPLPTKDEK